MNLRDLLGQAPVTSTGLAYDTWAMNSPAAHELGHGDGAARTVSAARR